MEAQYFCHVLNLSIVENSDEFIFSSKYEYSVQIQTQKYYLIATLNNSSEHVKMCSICFACCPPRTGCVMIAIFQIFIHAALFVTNDKYKTIQEIAYASNQHSKITMIILTTVGLMAALLLIFGATRRNIICLHIWSAVNTLIITAFTIGLIYCAILAKDDNKAQTSFWGALKRLFSFSTYQRYFKRISYYVTLIVIITVEVFLTFIAHDFTCEMELVKKIEVLGKHAEGDDDSGQHSHRHRRHHSHHRRRHHPHHIRKMHILHVPSV